MSERHKVNANGAELAVQIDGDSGKPWILVSNSLAADLTMWDDQIPLLTRTHRVLRYDTRGHGDSSAPEGPYTLDMLVADQLALLDHFKIRAADILGLSLGGMTGIGLTLKHPDRVRSLIAADARADNPKPFVDRWNFLIGIVEEKGREGILDATIERWFTPRTVKERSDITDRARRMILKTSPKGYNANAEALKGLNYIGSLPKLTRPVLYVVGAEDQGAKKADMQVMADATPGGRLAVVEGAAHIANMEEPAAFDAAIGDWLQDKAAKAA